MAVKRNRKKEWVYPVAAALLAMLTAQGCRKETPMPEPEPFGREPYTLAIPSHFPLPESAADNPLTVQGVALGRKLFYDGLLSANGKVSCATCHRQELAFSDGVAIAAHGVSGKPLERHAPALFNLAWHDTGLFWDGGSKNLESQAFGPLTHVDEMGMDLGLLEARLREDATYPSLFGEAFTDGVTAANVAKALAQFQRTLVSGNSHYDRYILNDTGTSALSEKELHGLSLVRQKCGGCHSGELFTDNGYHNNGIDDDFSDGSHEWIHRGRYRITLNPMDLGAFKTPSLRNVMVSAPYMHDGRFATIGGVLDHYAKGIRDTEVTDRLLYQNGDGPGIPMTGEERTAIIAFLHTLTDEVFLNNRDFSNPNN
ncbi:cytochrome-c peroxidase [Parapedobacter koreensis]|uniref:Cytochrome c peroxidase n=1 Tax=Parapedobacter koreensis TaxID=332977 RepID=A0A1H7F220_9SPHI|nr:cytochrome c peroxidase [Parapedobacter koreensis]SEK19407.1 cytochrome c peroxidase [Parapedobacter koreensis]